MQNIIPQTATASNQLEELQPFLEAFAKQLCLSLNPTTVKHELIILKHFFTHVHLSKKNYKAIGKEDIEAYAVMHPWALHTRAHTLFSIRRFYNYLKEKGIVAENPAQDIRIVYPKKQCLRQSPTLTEIKTVFRKLEQCRTLQGLRTRLMVELAYGSGLRIGEISTLNIEDISIANQTAHVLGKGRKERVVPLTRRCMKALESYCKKIREPRKALFVQVKGPHAGERTMPHTIGMTIRKKTGYHAHLYRHACATHMLLAGCNIRHIQDLLGHEQAGTTQIYTRLRNEELRQVINKKHPCASRISLITHRNMRNLHCSH